MATATEVVEAFRVFDTNGNGKVSKETFHFVLTKLGTGMSSDEATEIVNEADAFDEGSIDYSSFVHDVLFATR